MVHFFTVSVAEICHVNPLKVEANSLSQISAREMVSKQGAVVKYLLRLPRLWDTVNYTNRRSIFVPPGFSGKPSLFTQLID